MDILITAVVFLIILSVLVLVHEFGHFYMAKRAGIKVEEFGFGLPPRLWGKKKGETIYSINWIPFGGFVRMYGEDAHDKKTLNSKRSFAGKSVGARIKVIVAGVVMNFFLAWLLLTIAMIAGMRPLLTPDGVFDAVRNEQLLLEPGVRIETVSEEAATFGFEAGDQIVAFNGQDLGEEVFQQWTEDLSGDYVVARDGETVSLSVKFESLDALVFYNYGLFPAFTLYQLDNFSPLYAAGLREGDVVLNINEQKILTIEDLDQEISRGGELQFEIYRNNQVLEINADLPVENGVYVTDVVEGAPAFEAGIRPGDLIVSIGDESITSVSDLQTIVAGASPALYSIERGAEQLFLEVTPNENGRIGVILSNLLDLKVADGVWYEGQEYFSITEIKDVQYAWYQAPIEAFKESTRLSVATADMLFGVVKGIFRGDDVPDNVAGPIGIAQMTHGFVQEGIIPLLQFVAVLSLSLAVINILPVPALDGGRLLFILIELVSGRRVDQKLEAYVHAFGYILILGLILLVTYNDVLRLLS